MAYIMLLFEPDPLPSNLIGVWHSCEAEGKAGFDKCRNPDGSLRDTLTFKIIEEIDVKDPYIQAIRKGVNVTN